MVRHGATYDVEGVEGGGEGVPHCPEPEPDLWVCVEIPEMGLDRHARVQLEPFRHTTRAGAQSIGTVIRLNSSLDRIIIVFRLNAIRDSVQHIVVARAPQERALLL